MIVSGAKAAWEKSFIGAPAGYLSARTATSDVDANARPPDSVPSEPDISRGSTPQRFAGSLVVFAEAEAMTSDKSKLYHQEAEKCRSMAAQESCPDAREYYEALQRDYVKLASKELRSRGE
jgi:hypothetical protein